ncbi:MAG: TetR/AcrR family transcriptional regulator [Sphingomonadaceae bacterium]|nr:TetR/AcrR family transcriptional regulator [Sphingomonadaceae bacterium]
MQRKRITGQERKTLIMEAAKRVFSRTGYEAAKTQEIAREAKVSEALMYRHFPSKLALYRAVLRQTIREQDENFEELFPRERNARGIIQTLKIYFTHAASLQDDDMQQRFRMLLASLSGDGTYARLVYRRSQRTIDSSIEEALQNAREAGELIGEGIPVANTSMFIEHIGTMMSAIVAISRADTPYATVGDELISQAVRFCCRGLGFTDEAVTRYLDE